MSEEETNGADIALELGGQKVNVKNIKSLNTVATIATLIVVCLIAYGGYMHAQDSRDTGKEFVQAIKEQTGALKEQTTAAREQNCLLRFDQKDRQERVDFCKSIAR